MIQQSSKPILHKAIELNESEALSLANELKRKLREGVLHHSNSEQINLMVAGLSDKRGLLRRTFAESLAAVGEAAISPLTDALINHPNVTVRRAAAKSLRLAGNPKALPDLLKALINDPDPVVQGSAVGAMAVFGERAVELLLGVLKKPSSTTMQSGLAAWALSFIGAEAPEALRKAAESKKPLVRAAAIAAMGEQIQYLKDDVDKNLLIKSLNDSSSIVRAEATTMLGKLTTDQWVKPLLLNKIDDQSSTVRKNAAISLMKLNVVEAIGTLEARKRKESNEQVIKILDLSIHQLRKSK